MNNILRGQRGVRFKLRNVDGVEKGSFRNGAIDTLSFPDRILSAHLILIFKSYGEYLLKGKSGSIIAIEPPTAKSSPWFQVLRMIQHCLTGRNYSSNFVLISNDTNKPLFNRPLMAQYRPGSIFKIAQAMVAFRKESLHRKHEFDVTDPSSIVMVHTLMKISGEQLPIPAIHTFYDVLQRRMLNKVKSNNPFDDTRIGLEEWNKHIRSFGFGKRLGIDLPNEKGGLVPSPAYYDRAYGGRPWKFSNIYSIAIGEGENLVVPLQMANFAATIANKGYYITPHLVKSIGDSANHYHSILEKHYTTIDSAYFRIAADAMERVVTEGTGSVIVQS